MYAKMQQQLYSHISFIDLHNKHISRNNVKRTRQYFCTNALH